MPPEVLVVDDEAAVLQMLGFVLPQHGVAVRQAGGGEEAVAIYRRHRDRIAVVLLDVRMPGLDGPQALALLREINPDVRCCFMTGYAAGYPPDELLALGADRVLEKPFRDMADLAGTLREVASRRAG
jgi:two-component system, OmpR family, response regulator